LRKVRGAERACDGRLLVCVGRWPIRPAALAANGMLEVLDLPR
jgi:hypothetical protein